MTAKLPTPSQANEYNQPISPILCDQKDPKFEKDQFASLNFLWSTDVAGASGFMRVNVAAKATHFSRIKCMYIDNSGCTVPIAILFPDTNFRLHVDPGECGFFPVFSNRRDFYIGNSGVTFVGGDATFIQIFNFVPTAWLDQPRTGFMSFSTATLVVTGAGSTQLIAAGTQGTLRAIMIELFGVTGGAGAGQITIFVSDGSANNLGQAALTVANAQVIDQRILLQLSDLQMRFVNGALINVSLAGTAPVAGNCLVSSYWSVP